MLPAVNGSTESYLNNLRRIQSAMDVVQRQVSSGVRVGQASDDPAALPAILESVSRIALRKQSLSNMNQLQAELDSGDAALQQAVKLLDQAGALASEGASTPPGDAKLSTLATQARDLRERLVELSRTSANGRFIFSGDLDAQPLYALDSSQPEGVLRLATAASTRRVTDSEGNTIWTPDTANDIFDARDSDGTPSNDNVFRAVNDLAAGLQNGDPSAVNSSIAGLKAAQEHLNEHLGLYGIAQTRVTAAIDSANQSIVTENKELSSLRDTDVAAAAVELSQLTLQQQAALSAKAKLAPTSLFDFLA